MAFGGPDVPATQQVVAAPSPTSSDADTAAATRKAQEEAADIQRNARGRASTILNGGMGDTSSANISRRTLLGS